MHVAHVPRSGSGPHRVSPAMRRGDHRVVSGEIELPTRCGKKRKHGSVGQCPKRPSLKEAGSLDPAGDIPGNQVWHVVEEVDITFGERTDELEECSFASAPRNDPRMNQRQLSRISHRQPISLTRCGRKPRWPRMSTIATDYSVEQPKPDPRRRVSSKERTGWFFSVGYCFCATNPKFWTMTGSKAPSHRSSAFHALASTNERRVKRGAPVHIFRGSDPYRRR